MIGKVVTGNSFYHCFKYCLEDKINLTEEQKLHLSKKDNVQHKDRAEVLFYNSCFGNANELTSQFSEVSKLSRRVEKPVLHFTLSLAHGESLSKNQLIEMAQACTEAFKVDQNQFAVVLHKDTRAQHIHIVANRVGYDGKVASNSNSYLRMANLCRKLELKYHLKQVLNPRAFLSKEQRMIPRQNARMDKLKESIRQVLQQVKTLEQFEHKMKSLGYQVLKGRGIAFIDDKKVKFKGSEVGYSLMTIERILSQKQTQKPVIENEIDVSRQMLKEKRSIDTSWSGNGGQKFVDKTHEKEKEIATPGTDKNYLLEKLLKSEQMYEPDPFLPKKKRKKKQKPRQDL
ncbi:relaxase/mobilization nuclease domain-containing protein [Longitalea arenae]|uniref:relaxase/mobilization nuclease domain-containing protein n=1 Tax=Longitalea arenae TaxID=2812558 RepID=UPI0019682BF2|nr:relaxase/mobilization nuclease domain-containing protein [Longitalea arenae]